MYSRVWSRRRVKSRWRLISLDLAWCFVEMSLTNRWLWSNILNNHLRKININHPQKEISHWKSYQRKSWKNRRRNTMILEVFLCKHRRLTIHMDWNKLEQQNRIRCMWRLTSLDQASVLEEFHLEKEKRKQRFVRGFLRRSLTDGFTLWNQNETDDDGQTKADDEGPSFAVTRSTTIAGVTDDRTEEKTEQRSTTHQPCHRRFRNAGFE